jgi:YaiO family outer membrane protein
MRTALFAGLVSGAVCLHSFSAIAAEGSSLRGLKPPRDALEAEALAYVFTGASPGLKGNTDIRIPELAPRLSVYGGTLEARRFSANDIDFSVGLHQATGQNIAALAESNINTLHEVLPRYTLYSQMSRSLPGGWGLGFGVRHSEYSFGTSRLLSFSAERNWGSFRGGYTLFSDASGLGSTHRFQVSYLYGERNTIGLAYTTGRDIENLGLPLGMQFNDVRDWTLSGRHWLSPTWALTYDVLSQEQGNLLRRQGLRLGVSRSF